MISPEITKSITVLSIVDGKPLGHLTRALSLSCTMRKLELAIRRENFMAFDMGGIEQVDGVPGREGLCN